jgi:hypothetical protein
MQNKKKVKKSNVLKFWMFPLGAESLSCSLHVLYEGTVINILQFWTKNWETFQQQDNKIFGHQTHGSGSPLI